MPSNESSVTPVDLPRESRITSFYKSTYLADAYSIRLPENASKDPESLARFLYAQHPLWVEGLMAIRDTLVAGFGLKTARQLKSSTASSAIKRIGIFRIYETHANEIILGEDDKHLDFRLSVLCGNSVTDPRGASHVVVSTVVHCHNLLGRAYITLIAPFHRLIIQSGLRRAARIGWPTQP